MNKDLYIELTMLTSDTMSILATSILMPTATGRPVRGTSRAKWAQHCTKGEKWTREGRSHCGDEGSLTSKVRPETNIVSFQQFVHSLFDKRHVARFVDAARGKRTTRVNTLFEDGQAHTSRPALSPGHSPLRAAHHCHEQRQREDVKEPSCSLARPHPFPWCLGWVAAVRQRSTNDCAPSEQVWLLPHAVNPQPAQPAVPWWREGAPSVRSVKPQAAPRLHPPVGHGRLRGFGASRGLRSHRRVFDQKTSVLTIEIHKSSALRGSLVRKKTPAANVASPRFRTIPPERASSSGWTQEFGKWLLVPARGR